MNPLSITSIRDLPDELNLKILFSLSPKDLGLLSQTCVYFAHLTRDDAVWRAKTKEVFSSYVRADEKPEHMSWKDRFKELKLISSKSSSEHTSDSTFDFFKSFCSSLFSVISGLSFMSASYSDYNYEEPLYYEEQ